jgi:hypothetical protein
LDPSDPHDFCPHDRFLWLGIQAFSLRERKIAIIDWDTLSDHLAGEVVEIQNEVRNLVAQLSARRYFMSGSHAT